MYGNETVYLPPGYGRIRFGRLEKVHILVAVAVLTFAFAMVFYGGILTSFAGIDVFAFAIALGISFVIVLTGFLLHELAHKFVAQRNGAWAEFRIFPLGLILALIFSFTGFVFAAPGAVYIQGNISRRQNGIISLAGPLTNLVLGGLFLTGWMLIPGTGPLVLVLRWVGIVNLFFAAFNMIPIPPFDGSKIVSWNIGVYLAVLLTAVLLLLLGLGVM
ncbi:MAG: site-2 protease family protein [Methanomassiliicoccales archaeon]|jgi:Zn-dependent protease